MTPILFAIIIAFVVCAAFYYFVVLPERERFVTRTMERLENEVFHWKDLASNLIQRGLLFRELPLLNEDIETLSRPPRETDDGEETLEELEARQAEYDNPLNFSSEGELGERRRLAKAIALKKRDSDVKEKSELSTEHVENVFGPEDEQHLRSH